MFFIYYNKEKAQEIVDEINSNESVPDVEKQSKTATSIRAHPEKEKYAVPVGHLTHREYLNELLAQETLDELTDDWFEENE